MTRRRKRKGPRRGKCPAPYRSWFEHDCAVHLKKCDYEPKDAVLPYTSPHEYTPDFVPKSRNGIVFECKGRFRTTGEASKYKYARQDNPGIRIIFIFMSPDTPMPGAKPRKDGTKQTHAAWAEKNGFEWCTKDNIKKEWFK